MNKYMNMNNKNMSRKNGTLKWVGLVELIMGALNLSNGLLSMYVLFSQGQAVLDEIQKNNNITVTMSEMTRSDRHDVQRHQRKRKAAVYHGDHSSGMHPGIQYHQYCHAEKLVQSLLYLVGSDPRPVSVWRLPQQAEYRD